MAVTTGTNDADNTLRVLREALGTKMLANVMRLSREFAAENKAFETAVENLAQSIATLTSEKGLKPVLDHGGVHISRDFLTDATQIAAKVYAVWSERPIDLIIYCVQAMEDAREKERYAKVAQGEEQDRYRRFVERIEAAQDMDAVRAALEEDDY